LILQALRATRWVVGGPHGAAVRLGLKRTTLGAIIKRLGISRPLPKDDPNELADNEDREYQLTA